MMSLYRSVLATLLLFGFAATAVQSTSFYNESTNEIDLHADGESSGKTGTEQTRGLFRHLYSPPRSLELSEEEAKDAGAPLFLTPYIQEGKINEARTLSRVTLPDDPKKTQSFSGYLTVDPKYDSNMFFWFFPAKKSPHTAPTMIWLQGGPGSSSLYGLFMETGPFNVDVNMKLVYREYSWTDHHNMLYFDNPVGTGYSFTRDDAGYAKNEIDVGENLYRATVQFLQLFPELQQNDFYISGESYAGKYIPALAYTIHKRNPTADLKINFKGMAIGDGLCDPATMMGYGDYLYGHGMLDEAQRDEFEKRQNDIIHDINHQLYVKAFMGFDALLNGDMIKVPSLFTNMTGLTIYFNYLLDELPADMDYYSKYVNQPSIRRAMHVGNMTFNDGSAVEKHLMNDVMDSVKPWIEELLNHREYRVMFYNGEVDVIVAYPLTRSFIESMEWNDAHIYRTAPRKIWKVGGDVAGYVKETPNMVEVMVRGAGHMVPYDQPKRSYDMINRFTGAGQASRPAKNSTFLY